jgi:hypothetical protein
MPDLTGSAGPFGPATALTSLTVGGVPTQGMGNSLPITTGNTYFVSSVTGAAANDGLSLGAPLAKVWGTTGAHSKCTTTNNDVIVVLPGHTETLSSATTVKLDKAGVTITGLGYGAYRPTFTIDTGNTVTINVSAANVTVNNCVFVGNFLSIAACFTLTTAANFTLTNCLFSDAGASLDFLNIIKSTGAANTIDGLTVINNRWNGLGTTSVSTFILTAAAVDKMTVMSNTVNQVATTDLASLIIATTGALTNLICAYNRTTRLATTSTVALISGGSTTSNGFVYNNYMQTKDTSTNTIATASTGLSFFENYLTGVLGASGFIKPDRDT